MEIESLGVHERVWLGGGRELHLSVGEVMGTPCGAILVALGPLVIPGSAKSIAQWLARGTPVLWPSRVAAAILGAAVGGRAAHGGCAPVRGKIAGWAGERRFGEHDPALVAQRVEVALEAHRVAELFELAV